MIITVNARQLDARKRKLTYDQIVLIAYGPTEPGAIYTVTYYHPRGPNGSLQQGQSVRVRAGIRFTCVQTTKA